MVVIHGDRQVVNTCHTGVHQLIPFETATHQSDRRVKPHQLRSRELRPAVPRRRRHLIYLLFSPAALHACMQNMVPSAALGELATSARATTDQAPSP
ncbi:hypothetical protein V7S43_007405 [Phytophthora oleae]|uniref:Uncharacterized protein n=1 Tax=Phytophthora oleae TaxID=2107226 RepID=A0ABD3FQD3_9STRA